MRGSGISSFASTRPALVLPSTGFLASFGIIQSRPNLTAPSIFPPAQSSCTRRTPIPHFLQFLLFVSNPYRRFLSEKYRFLNYSPKRPIIARLNEIYYTSFFAFANPPKQVFIKKTHVNAQRPHRDLSVLRQFKSPLCITSSVFPFFSNIFCQFSK